MSYLHRFIIVSSLFFATNTFAFNFFLEPLYWQASENVDWALTVYRSTPNQNTSYRTIDFNFEPGFRVGFGYEDNWNMKFYYTRYYTKANDSVSGDVRSAFIGTTPLAQPNNNYFYRYGEVNFAIDFNMFDTDFGKSLYATKNLMIRPIIGLKGGWINQTINTSFQGTTSVTEHIKNNFSGVGPKAEIEGELSVLKYKNYNFSLFEEFGTAYLYGYWHISDNVYSSNPQEPTINIIVKNRNFGALALQTMLGVKFDYKKLSLKLAYEIADWFNQCQIFDDDTGPHNNSLVLQGITLNLSYDF